MPPQPFLDLAEHPLSTVVDGDDVSRSFGPYELFFRRANPGERKFSNRRRDTGVFTRLYDQCRRDYLRE